MMTQIAPQVKPFTGSFEEILAILGLQLDDYDSRFPMKLAYTGNWDLLIPMMSIERIDSLKPDMKRLKQHNLKYEITSVHLFCMHNKDIYTRNFAPAVGIDEDPVTGSTNGALVGYLMLENKLSWANHQLKVIQTNSEQRMGELMIKTNVNGDELKILVGGIAVPSLEGKIMLKEVNDEET